VEANTFFPATQGQIRNAGMSTVSLVELADTSARADAVLSGTSPRVPEGNGDGTENRMRLPITLWVMWYILPSKRNPLSRLR
jgi:hypothetical protein